MFRGHDRRVRASVFFSPKRRAMKTFISIAMVASGALPLALSAATPAQAETGPSITFEPPTYSTGSIQGQDGWGGSGSGLSNDGTINPNIDQEVVLNGITAPEPAYATQSFRLSN